MRTPGLRFEGQLTAQGYAGWIGCEYKAAGPSGQLDELRLEGA